MATPEGTPPTFTACQRCGAENAIENVVRCSGCGNRAADGTACHQICVNCAGRIGCERECLHCGACETTSNSAHRVHCGSFHEKCFESCIKNVESCVHGSLCNHSNHPCCAAEHCVRKATAHQCCRGPECAVIRAVQAANEEDPLASNLEQHCCLGNACLLRSQRHTCCRGVQCQSRTAPLIAPRLRSGNPSTALPMTPRINSVPQEQYNTDRLYILFIAVAVVFMVTLGYIGGNLLDTVRANMIKNISSYEASSFFKPYINYKPSENAQDFVIKPFQLPVPWNNDKMLQQNATHFYTTPIVDFINNISTHNEIVFSNKFNQSEVYQFSPSKKAVTSRVLIKKEYRHGGFYLISIYKIINKNRELLEIIENVRGFYWLNSMNSKTGIENYIYVKNNDVYLNDERLTDSKSPLHYFGISDWLYEEEILLSDSALLTSPDGNHFAYIEFDDSAVPLFEVPYYYANQRRPNFTTFPYPKVGDKNPTVKLWVNSVDKKRATEITVPNELANIDHYIFNFAFGPDYIVSVWANRFQNVVIVKTNRLTSGFPDVHKPLKFSMTVNGLSHWADPRWFKPSCVTERGYYLLTPAAVGNDVFNAVTRIDLTRAATNPVVQSTSVNFDEDLPIYCDAETNEFYFISNGGNQRQKYLYRKRIPGAAPEPILFADNDCKIVESVNFIGDYLFGSCMSALYGNRTYIVKKFRTNEIIKKTSIASFQSNVSLPIIRENDLFVNNLTLQTLTILPKNFTDDRITKHPLVLLVYSGPEDNRLLNFFPILSFFAAYRGYIVVMVNGRGSGGRGWKLSNPMMENFGRFEIEDAIEATKQIMSMLNGNVETNKVGVFGWSYGGFASGHIAAKDNGKTFKCASMGAPVTHFALYDSAYTERYLHFNRSAYDEASLLRDDKLNALANVKLQLIHGLADDNVHFQHHALLSAALQAKGSHFRQSVYSNKDHGVFMDKHVTDEIDKFFTEDCFGYKLKNF